MWQDVWKQYVDSLSEDQRREIFESMGLQVRGFRKGAKTTPATAIRNQLQAAPSKRDGKLFLHWFRNAYAGLLEHLEEAPWEQLDAEVYELVQKYPSAIVRIAFAIARPELAEAWEDRLKYLVELEARHHEQRERLMEELGAVKKRISELDGELRKAGREREKLEAEVEKLRREVAEWKQRADEARREGARERDALAGELERLKQQYDEQLLSAAALQERLAQAERERAQDAATIDQLAQKVAAYQRRRLEAESLFQLYQALAGRVEALPEEAVAAGYPEDDADMRFLVVGDEFEAQLVNVQGRLLRFESAAAPEHPDDAFAARCAGYDRVILLSACPHRTRLWMYQQLGARVIEVSSLSQLRPELIVGEWVR